MYTWDNTNQKCTYDENVHYLSTTGDRTEGYGLTLKSNEPADKSECCRAGIETENPTSPLLWACELEEMFEFDTQCKKTIWSMTPEGSAHEAIEVETVGNQECCAVSVGAQTHFVP